LGKASTPTFTGTKVLMERDKVKRIVGTTPGDEYDLQVPWSVRLTNSGEFIHAASWNGGNIGQRSTSNGCTNLNLDAAQQYFSTSRRSVTLRSTSIPVGPHARLGRLRRLEPPMDAVVERRVTSDQLTISRRTPAACPRPGIRVPAKS